MSSPFAKEIKGKLDAQAAVQLLDGSVDWNVGCILRGIKQSTSEEFLRRNNRRLSEAKMGGSLTEK